LWAGSERDAEKDQGRGTDVADQADGRTAERHGGVLTAGLAGEGRQSEEDLHRPPMRR
jgi:hypothetical protein